MIKRWLWVVLLASVAALFVGCGSPTPSITNPNAVQRISVQDAKALLDAGEAVLYDTRSAAAYRMEHAAGAISLPEQEVTARIDELPEDGPTLILYCT